MPKTKPSPERAAQPMPQSLARLHIRLVIGTTNREPLNVDAVREYIANQREHRRKKSFQEEYRQFLQRHRIVFDERYVWD
jgi:putative transposase